MVQPVEPSSKGALQEQYSISSRTAIRIGALWEKGLGISEGLIDAARPDTAFEQLLLSRPLLKSGGSLDPETFEQMLDEDLTEEQIPPEPVTVDADGSRPVLCLKEERLAEHAWEDEAAEDPQSDSTEGSQTDAENLLPEEAPDSLSLLDEDESEPLFSEENVNDLKLTLLTGVDPGEKIEALRKIAYAPVEERTKGTLFLNALTDEDAEVREEAAKGLEQLGLSGDLSDTLQTFLSGDLEQKRYAGEKIKNSADAYENFEKAVTVALLNSELSSTDRVEVHVIILEVLHSLADFIAKNAGEHLQTLTKRILEILVANFHDVHEPVRDLYRAIGSTVPERVYDILWKEAQQVDARELKAYLLILLGELPAGDGQKRSLANEMVETIRDWSDTEIECRRLGNALVQLKEPAVHAIIDQFSEAGTQQGVYLLRLLDETMLDLTPNDELQDKLESFLIDITKIQDRNIREPLLDLHLLHHVSLTPDTRTELARLLMEPLKRFEGDRIARMTPILLEKMGRHILPVLMEYLKDGTYDIQREVSLEVLGNLFPKIDPGELDKEELEHRHEQLQELDAYLSEQIENEEADLRKDMIVTRARALAAPISNRDRAREHMDELRDNVNHGKDLYASLQALGWLAASPLISEDRAMETGVLFLNYLEQDLPEQISQETDDETGRTLFVEKESEAYTDLLPTVIDGLTRICERKTLKPSFRERIGNELLDRWHDLVNFDLIWGPGTVTRLARNFGSLCTCEHVPIELKERFLKGLSRRVDNLSVVDIIGNVLGSGLESKTVRKLCKKITKAMLEMLEQPDFQNPEDRRILLDNLGQICSRRNLAGDRKENKHLRKKVIDALVDGLYDHIEGVKSTLEDLSSNDQVPQKYRDHIQSQLSRYRDS